jgi:subtilisin family serine protease
MHPRNAPRLSAGPSLAVALALACVLVAASAAQAAVLSGEGVLSPRLAELAKPAVRDAAPAEQARQLSVASEGPGSLLRDGNRVVVDVRFDRGAGGSVDELRGAGAEVLNASAQYQTVTVAARPDELQQLARVPQVAGVKEVLTPITHASTCPSGVVVSQGEQQLRAGEGEGAGNEDEFEARKLFGADGSGVTVGILSDSFNRASKSIEGGSIATKAEKDVENGDLPGPANTCSGQSTPVDPLDDSESEGEDEGRAMAQIVHDLAPGADLAFATAFTSEIGFAENIERLAKPSGEGGAEAKVIADDVAYFEEPFFQEGPVGVAVTNVSEDGVAYFSAAGNDNLFNGGNEIASWEAPQFRDSGSCPSAIGAFEAEIGFSLNGSHCMDFNPGAGIDNGFGITVEAGETLLVDLQWAEAWEGVSADLDAFLIGPGGGVVAGGVEDNPAEGRPVEILGWENESGSSKTVQLAINRFSGGSPRLKFGLLENGRGVSSTEYESSKGGDVVGPTIFGHAGSPSVVGIGAIPYFDSSEPEPYSSRGPVTHYFGPVQASGHAPKLVTPEVIGKPDVTATDCADTTFFARFRRFLPVSEEPEKSWHFCGTSAAAPHAAAVAALMLEEEPAAEPAQIRAALVESAVPVGGFGPCAVGGGLIEAVGAVNLIATGEAGVPPGACLPPESGPWIEPEGGSTGGETVVVPTPPPEPLPQANTSPKSKRRSVRTFFLKHPRAVVRTRGRRVRVVFRFGANEHGVVFLCNIDSGPFHPCRARFVHRFTLGRHSVRVKARDADGNVDKTPAVFRFKVKRIGHG